jgi:hypothetical protein
MQKPSLTDWRSLYLYAVCFVCVVVVIVTTMSLVGNIMSLVYPSPPIIDVPRVWWCRHVWFQATGWADWCSSSNSTGVRIPRAE